MVVSKHVFWQAFIFTVVIFIIGLIAGFFLEVSRSNNIEAAVARSETSLLDEQLRNRAIGTLNLSCDDAINSTFSFADAVYYEARQLEQYESSSTFTDSLTALHKRYDLLRTMLWFEGVDLRTKCKGSFHTIVYLYDYDTDDVSIRAKQLFFSRILSDLKNNNPDSVLLIPIARNLGLESVRLASDKFEVKSSPVIIVDEKIKIYEIDSFDEFEKLVLQSNN